MLSGSGWLPESSCCCVGTCACGGEELEVVEEELAFDGRMSRETRRAVVTGLRDCEVAYLAIGTIEVNQPNDPSSKLKDQPSLVYEVEVDNYDPYTFQLLELVGYPVMEENDEKEEWYLSYADESIESAFEIVDSALLQIDRELDKSFFNAKPSP